MNNANKSMGNSSSNTASNFESAIPSSQLQVPSLPNENTPQVSGTGLGPSPTRNLPLSPNGIWWKRTATDFLKSASDDLCHPRDIHSGNDEISQSSNKDYGWLVDEAKHDDGILDNLKYVGYDNYHLHEFEL
ncbi:unnamed protein product [Ambrosiozyma monospora]|uniref:Unnamed protein product n=1 Tax=Ambrosiozyma monospora TaxID=43982 RepID=A0ACB5UCB0_AMBMO|nr:unnamed protein product [Ambrosiozyma monospora]